ncbi:hypothetical protein LPJ53_006605, partial [Coemansia erecta]
PPQFGIRHWLAAAPVQYSVDEFCRRNMDLEASPDLYALLSSTSHSSFVRRLFGIDQIMMDYHPEEELTIVGCFLSTRPASRPTVSHLMAELETSGGNPGDSDPVSRVAPLPLAVEPLQLPTELPPVDASDPANTFIGEVSGALDDVFAAADRCKVWHVLHVRASPAHAGQQPAAVDSAFVQQQVHALGLADMALRRTPTEFTVAMPLDTFVRRYAPVVDMSGDELASVLIDHVAQANGWAMGQHYMLGSRHVFMTERVWRSIETPLRVHEKQRALARRRGHGDAGMLEALAQGDESGELAPPHAMFNFGDNTDAASTAYGSEAESTGDFDPDADGFFSHDDADGDSDGDLHGNGRHGHSDDESDGMSAV